jgi:DNA (cytosine-5)-methyltransferase 1
MKHLLNICNINGAEVESVDVVIGGSPCQDLSVAGKRAGLDGECSGLFMEQIRIIKEMRDADKLRIERLSDTKIRGRSGTDNTSGKGGVCGDIRNTNAVSADCGEGGTTTIESGITQHGLCGAGQLVRPRYMVWENVPGAFSSNKGEDFRIVLEETARIADETAVIPKPPKGKWTTSGAIMGNGWSIAWRVFDAQFWGVPQRRRRIALVADFGGHTAPEILFERQGVSGDITESGAEGQGVAGGVEAGVGEARGDTAETLRAQSHGAIPMVAGFCQGASPAAQTIGYQEEVSPTIKGAPSGTAQVPAVLYEPKSALEENWGKSNVKNALRAEASKSSHAVVYPEVTGTICASGAGTNRPAGQCNEADMCIVMAHGQANAEIAKGFCTTLNCNHEQPIVAAVDCRNYSETGEVFGTLQAKENGGQSLNYMGADRQSQSVRRLTPLEYERLQGFPDGWTDIGEYTDSNGKRKQSSDSARYKALGNSIALPPWRFVLSRIHAFGARKLGSLFDGIGGFPLIWSELPGTTTAWASEIESFCIAVTMLRLCGLKELDDENSRRARHTGNDRTDRETDERGCSSSDGA